MLDIRNRIRGMNRSGWIDDGETSDALESPRSKPVSTPHLFAQRQAVKRAFELVISKMCLTRAI
jgi:hypothetical protein